MFDVTIKNEHMKQLAEYREELKKNPELKHLFLELTTRCNERCLHCGSYCGEVQNNEMTLDQYKTFLDQIKEDFDISNILHMFLISFVFIILLFFN